jgi:hypothetical protein
VSATFYALLSVPRARERKINSDFLALFGFFLCAAAKLFVLHSSPAALSQPNENNKTAGFKILISNLENKTRPRAWLDARFCFCLFQCGKQRERNCFTAAEIADMVVKKI